MIFQLRLWHNTENCEVMSILLAHLNYIIQFTVKKNKSNRKCLQFSESMVPVSFYRVDANTNVELDYGIFHAILLHRLAHGRLELDPLAIVLARPVPLDSFQYIVHVHAPYDHQWSLVLRRSFLRKEYFRSSWILFFLVQPTNN